MLFEPEPFVVSSAPGDYSAFARDAGVSDSSSVQHGVICSDPGQETLAYYQGTEKIYGQEEEFDKTHRPAYHAAPCRGSSQGCETDRDSICYHSSRDDAVDEVGNLRRSPELTVHGLLAPTKNHEE